MLARLELQQHIFFIMVYELNPMATKLEVTISECLTLLLIPKTYS